MADIHIQRSHQLGLSGARKLAWAWAEQAERDFDMQCSYEEAARGDEDACDQVQFTRSGVNGTLRVTEEHFELNATLGFLLGAFKDRIQAEIVKNLDSLLAGKSSGGKKPAPKAKVSESKKVAAPAGGARKKKG